MSTSTKLTNKLALTYVLDNCNIPADVRAKIEGMLSALEKKTSTARKPTSTQIANEGLKEAIVNFLSANFGKGFTVTELIKSIDEISDASNQKVSALLRLLKNEGKVDTYSAKRKTYFTAKIG